jgi:hypothetical protein
VRRQGPLSAAFARFIAADVISVDPAKIGFVSQILTFRRARP